MKVLKLTPPLSRHIMKFAPTFRFATTPLAIVSENICSHNMNQKLLYPRNRSRMMYCWLTMYMVGKCLFKWSIDHNEGPYLRLKKKQKNKTEKSTPPPKKRSSGNRTCNCWTCKSMYCNFILLISYKKAFNVELCQM